MAGRGKPLNVRSSSRRQKAEILRYAVETRNFEIERLWQRSLFFWGFIAAAFLAYASASASSHVKHHRLVTLLIACFGIVGSIAWTLQNRGSKYWQEAWEAKIKAVEKDVLGADLFENKEPLRCGGWWGPARYSVSRLSIALSDFTILVWIGLASIVFPRHHAPDVAPWPYFFFGVTGLFVACLFVGGQSRPD